MNKKLIFLILLALMASVSFAQSVGINDNGSSPNSSAMLDVSSTSKGFLPPRMTLVQRNSISSPVAGLIIWCSNCGTSGELQVYNGTTWTNMIGGAAAAATLAIGDPHEGGIIFYLDGTGQHGLIAAESDQSTLAGAAWGCSGTSITTGTGIGSGQSNTTNILNGCSEEGIAARLCDNYESGGFSDWYLPSNNELAEMYVQRAEIGGFSEVIYWSSSAFSVSDARGWNFSNGNATWTDDKSTPLRVRAIRTF